MALSSTIMQGAGAATSATGAYFGAASKKSSLGFDAQIAELNAQQSERQAQQTLAAGQMQKQQSQLRTAQLKSTQRAAMSANGVDITEGSARDILTSTDVVGQTDANTIEANAVRSAWGYRTQETNYKNEALMDRANASAINPTMSAATSLVGSASSLAPQWMSSYKSGAYDAGLKKLGFGGGAPAPQGGTGAIFPGGW
jgi:Tfp pilus assembly protein FimV